jgi:leishmanolysin-like peptidase
MHTQSIIVVLILLLVATVLCHEHHHHDDFHQFSDSIRPCGHMEMIKEPEIQKMSTQRLLFKNPLLARSMRGSQQSAFNRIRITFDTYATENDLADRYCTSEGSVVRVGRPTDDSAVCSDTVNNNCYLTCTADDVVTSATLDQVKTEIIPRLKSLFEGMLLTRTLTGSINLPEDICGDFPIAPALLQSGVDASSTDLVIIVALRPQINVLGYSYSCGFEPTYNRPVIGLLNLIPRYLSNAGVLDTAAHELIHTLGFTPVSYPKFVDDNGNPRGEDNVVQQITRSFTDSEGNEASITTSKIITPRVTQAVKDHFDCQEQEGAELEEFGGGSSAGAHWEARIFNNEIMTSSDAFEMFSNKSVLSQFTLALLEDSGWYKVSPDYTVEKLIWGRGTGCAIPDGTRCEDWNIDRQGYFCDAVSNADNTRIERCNFEFTSISYCGIADYKQNLGYYQHLSNPQIGGLSSYDYCPLVIKFNNGDCGVATSDLAKLRGLMNGQYFGAGSACFNSNLAPSTSKTAEIEARCFRAVCDNGVLGITVGSTVIQCPSDQSAARITTGLPSGYSGYVECPEQGYDIICGGRSQVSPIPSLSTPPSKSPAQPPVSQSQLEPRLSSSASTLSSQLILIGVILVISLCVVVMGGRRVL